MTWDEWPADWAERVAGKECPLCLAVGSGDNDYTLLLWTGEVTEARLQRRTSVPGYCMVMWSGSHVSEPDELSADDNARYWKEVVEAGEAIRTAYQPLKVNYLTLGNAVPHLHTHVFPRLPGDAYPGRPFPWDVLADVPPMAEQELQEQTTLLRAAHRTTA